MMILSMELGDMVLYHGRRYVLRGFSTVGPHVVIEDAETHELLSVPLEEVEPEPEPPVAA
jgi:hypothetical protein